jgi:hypothetical protein
MPINPDAFKRESTGRPSPMTRWLGEMKELHTELVRIVSRFHSGELEAGGEITVEQRRRLDDRYDVIITRLQNRLDTGNRP